MADLVQELRPPHNPALLLNATSGVKSRNGTSAGLNKITGDLAAMAAQVPALFESLSGMQFSELLSKVKLIGDKPPRPETTVEIKS